MRAARRGVLAAVLVLLAPAACRDDPGLFRPPGAPDPPEGLFRLTLSPFHDAAPAWTPDGAEVVYTAGQTDLFPDASGAVVAVPASGGQSRAVATAYQESVTIHNLAAPALSPDGQRLAVAELRITFPLLCDAGETIDCGEEVPPVPGPELGLVVISVRDLGGPASGPEYAIAFPDARPNEAMIHDADPYQRFYSLGGVPFRPTWSPDGRSVAFSDGAALYLWTPGDGEPQPVSGTAASVSPAWSPDGARIAFVQLIGAPTEAFACTCMPGDPKAPTSERRVTEIAEHRLALLDVASGEIALLGIAGRDPAWSPDGEFLYVSRLGQLWRLRPEAPGEAVPIPATEGGRHPAVSPDGGRVAFTVPGPTGLGDIWILPLEPTP